MLMLKLIWCYYLFLKKIYELDRLLFIGKIKRVFLICYFWGSYDHNFIVCDRLFLWIIYVEVYNLWCDLVLLMMMLWYCDCWINNQPGSKPWIGGLVVVLMLFIIFFIVVMLDSQTGIPSLWPGDWVRLGIEL